MERRAQQRRRRNDLLWYLVGFVALQLALGVAVDQLWPAVRDPDYADLEQIVLARQAEACGRPLALALGSSRTQMALDAGSLSQSGAEGPLLVNCGLPGTGPVMQQVALRRLLLAGARPRRVYLEVIPMGISTADGAPIEECRSFQHRYDAAEVARVWGYSSRRFWLGFNWGGARLVACARHRGELRDALRVDVLRVRPPRPFSRDRHGWVTGAEIPPADAKRQTALTLREYGAALAQPAVAAGPVRAIRDLACLCREKGIDLVLLVPPENSAFRAYHPAAAEAQMAAVRSLAGECGAALIDARAWVGDDGFFDGHHLHARGARQFTERFAQEMVRAPLAARSSR